MSQSDANAMVDDSVSRTVVIGDIHGCWHALRTLIEVIEPQRDELVIPLGDVVDRGSDTRGVLDVLLELRGQCILKPLMGNHEEMMLAVLDGKSPNGWVRHGGAATLDSYGFTGSLDVVPTEHIDFLRSFDDCVESKTHFFVHANYEPKLPLTQQPRRTLRWTSLKEHLPNPHMSGKMAIVGHTANRDGQVVSLPHLKCVDTYCYGGGWLTAYDINSGEIWQANQDGKVRSTQMGPIRPRRLTA